MAEEGDPQGAPEENEPTDRYAGGAMVHVYRTGPMVGAGHDKDAEASITEPGGRCPQQRQLNPRRERPVYRLP